MDPDVVAMAEFDPTVESWKPNAGVTPLLT